MIVHGLADGLFVVINGAEERQSLNVMKICHRSVPCKCKSQHCAVLVDLRKKNVVASCTHIEGYLLWIVVHVIFGFDWLATFWTIGFFIQNPLYGVHFKAPNSDRTWWGLLVLIYSLYAPLVLEYTYIFCFCIHHYWKARNLI